MPHPSRFGPALLFAALLGLTMTLSAAESGSFFSGFLTRDLNVLTVTDMTPEGKQVRRPTKKAPVYYEALNLGYQNFGRSIAGERLPDKKTMLKLIMKVLADQGYFPARKDKPPTLYLVFAWGSVYRDPTFALSFMGGDRYDLLWEYESQVGGALNPKVLLRGMRSGEAQTIFDMSQDQIYIASIRAYDEVKVKNGYAALLWHTKVSCPASGLAMDTSLAQMVRIAGPHLGRETGLPTFQNASSMKEVVTFGELKVLDSIDPDRLPVTDVSEWDLEEKNGSRQSPTPSPKSTE